MAEAAQFYTLLTIGDGLVAQLPSLLLSTAAAIMVTRASGSQDIGQQVTQQLFGSPQTLGVTAGIIGMLGLIPGMPNLVFLSLAGGAGYLAWRLAQKRRTAPAPAEGGDAGPGSGRERG
jgi:flagellar biosynthesis protein FlhA